MRRTLPLCYLHRRNRHVLGVSPDPGFLLARKESRTYIITARQMIAGLVLKYLNMLAWVIPEREANHPAPPGPDFFGRQTHTRTCKQTCNLIKTVQYYVQI